MDDNIKKEKGIKVPHKRASKIIFFTCAALALMLAVTLVLALVLLFFPVTEIEVVGDSRYGYNEVIDASGIKVGSRLYYVNEAKTAEKILTSLPYLESAVVNSYFPNRVKIEIKEFDDIYLIRHESGFCYVNGDFEILEIVESAPSFNDFSGIFVKLEKEATGTVGSFYEGEDAQRVKELVEYLKEYGFYQYLNIVDVEEKYGNAFVIGKRYKFVIGAMADVENKIDASFKVCFSDSFKQDQNCIIDATDKKRVILRYITDEIILNEFDFCEN